MPSRSLQSSLLAALALAVCGCDAQRREERATKPDPSTSIQIEETKVPREARPSKREPKRSELVVLPGPQIEGWELPAQHAKRRMPDAKYQLYAVVDGYSAPIFERASRNPAIVGTARYGRKLSARPRATRSGCSAGRWYEVPGEGFICSAGDFVVVDEPRGVETRFRPPNLSKPLPFQYAQVVTDGAVAYERIPGPREQRLAERGRKLAVVAARMAGDYFLAVDKLVESKGRRFYRTARGRYVKPEDLEMLPPPPMHGEFLEGDRRLPLAFVFGTDTTLYRAKGGRLRESGVAQKHARFAVARTFQVDGDRYAASKDGLAVARANLRIAEAVARPREIPQGARWIHVNLSEQTLVAYEGDEPVFATLVSSGKEGHDTPTGLYRVQRKYASKTMRGHDPVDGPYEVEEVPWAMYYRGNYALHGAYWHDVFGETRSHGCTNIAQADAQWLFHWSKPHLPPGWHSMLRVRGTWALVTR